MPLKGGELFARFGIPELDGLVITSRGDLATIRGIRHTIHIMCMPLKGGELFARFGIPQFNCVVPTSRGDLATIRGIRHTSYPFTSVCP